MNEKIYLYPVWIRFWHWFNAILCLLLIVTGISMQYSNPDYPLIRFDWSVLIHNIAGVALFIAYCAFTLGNMVTVNGKHYKFRKGLIGNLSAQAWYYAIGIFKGDKPPFPISEESKFNPLQKFSYIFVMHLVIPLLVISGILLLFPELIFQNILGNNALYIIAIIHMVMGFLVSLFLIVHVYFCTIGQTPTSNFKSMFNGYHEKHD